MLEGAMKPCWYSRAWPEMINDPGIRRNYLKIVDAIFEATDDEALKSVLAKPSGTIVSRVKCTVKSHKDPGSVNPRLHESQARYHGTMASLTASATPEEFSLHLRGCTINAGFHLPGRGGKTRHVGEGRCERLLFVGTPRNTCSALQSGSSSGASSGS